MRRVVVTWALATGAAYLEGLRVVIPEIGSSKFHVTEYGAQGDGETEDTLAIQAALDDCALSPDGGKVVFEAGKEFLSLPLTVSGSNCCLEVQGTLRQKYWNSSETDLGKGFITADTVSDILIYSDGEGVIDGNGQLWWPYADARPHLVHTSHVTNLAIYKIWFKNGPSHNLELYADNTEVAFSNVTTDWTLGTGHNTDGIDIHGTPFYVHDCWIDVGDDNVAIHASDVLVEDCHFGGPEVGDDYVHGHGASIGSVGSGNRYQNITVRNSFFQNTHVGPNIKIDAGARDGRLHDVHYENLSLDGMTHQGIRVNTAYSDEFSENTVALVFDASQPFVLDDITYTNITMINTDTPGTFICTDDMPCVNMRFDNVTAVGNSEDDWECTDLYGTQTNVDPKVACLEGGFPASYSYSFSFEEPDDSAAADGLGQFGPPDVIIFPPRAAAPA